MNPSATQSLIKSPVSLAITILMPALLFWLAWYPMPATQLLFIGLLPLFLLAHHYVLSARWKFYGSLYLSILLFNITTTWWVWNSTPTGAIAMLVLNALFMLLPFAVFRFAFHKSHQNLSWALAAFAVAWLWYEFGHHRWDLSWPWLALGNGLVGMPSFIQWYEITGTLGGSFLVLFVNALIYRAIITKSKTRLILPAITLALLFLLSTLLKKRVDTQLGNPIHVTVLQPNYDPWNEKFEKAPLSMVEEMWNTSLQHTDSNTQFILWPETSLVGFVDLDQIGFNPQVSYLKSQIQKHPAAKNHSLSLITGINAAKFYRSQEKPHPDARNQGGEFWYVPYNSAMDISSTDTFQYYHKSKLVPGTEQLPFVKALPFLESLAVSLDENSTTGTLGISEEAKALGSENPVAPLICYESIYGDYVNDFIAKGATWLGIVTNDAWWDNSPGFQQHFIYATLRAIEQRKWVARSANTGVSGFINPKGEIVNHTGWYEGRPGKQSPYQYFWGFPKTSTQQELALAQESNQHETHNSTAVNNHQMALSATIYANKILTLYQKTGDLFWLLLFTFATLVTVIIKNYNA